jgi:TPR repeat protein
MDINTIEQAEVLYQKGKYKEAFDLCFSMASTADKYVQTFIGWCFYTGEGTNKNIDDALYWFTLASKENYYDALYGRGLVYIQKDEYKKALDNFKLASDEGYLPATYWLGKMYRDGFGAEKNFEKAFELFKFGSKFGNLRCQKDYGLMLIKFRLNPFLKLYGIYLCIKFFLELIYTMINDPNSQRLRPN